MLLYRRDVSSAADNRPIALGVSGVQDRANIWRVVQFIDRVIAGGLLVVTLPVLFFSALIIVVLSRQSPFVAHQRVGHTGRLIWILKLRTMWTGNSERSFTLVHRLGTVDVKPVAPARKGFGVTSRFAAFCRRYSIDELPQLWQVLSGELALVGPRPITRQELDDYYGADTPRVLAAKPGLSGLWQISGRSRLTYAQRRRLDLFLVRKWSIPLYCRILLTTVPRVLAGKDAW